MNQPLDPRAQKAQAAFARLLSTPPETIISMLDRLQIPWDKRKNKEGTEHLIIKWKDLIEGEKRNQAEGPFIRKLAEEMKEEM